MSNFERDAFGEKMGNKSAYLLVYEREKRYAFTSDSSVKPYIPMQVPKESNLAS